MKGLLDTSVFVAREQDRSLGRLPDEAAISVVTIAELHVGVLMATDEAARATRLRTLSLVERTFDPLDVDAAVARTFAEIVVNAKQKETRPKILDSLIAATAIAHGLKVFTQDRDFEQIAGLETVLV